MGELLAAWPSAPLTLFARFGVGSRDKLGFRPDLTLRQTLARHLIFDPEPVLQQLRRAEAEQSGFRCAPAEFARRLPESRVIDCRSEREHEMLRLPGAVLLDAQAVAELQRQPQSQSPVCLYDANGTQVGAAAAHLARLGLTNLCTLDGGLHAWARLVDPGWLDVGGDSGRLPRILPGDLQARFAWHGPEVGEGDPDRVPFRCARLWLGDGYLAVLRSESRDWHLQAPRILAWLADDGPARHPWRPRPEWPDEEQVRQLVERDAQPLLQSHKGKVELVSWQHGVARLRLGGGCQGCSAAALTIGQDIAGALWLALPELERIEDASEHDHPNAQPHR